MLDRCLFCKEEFARGESIEHLIPAALGGWLTTEDVCHPCNSLFGHEVDSFVDHYLVLALRQEVGLPINRPEQWEYFDKEVGATVRGWLTASGEVVPLSPVHEDGNRFVVRAESQAAGEAIVRKIRSRRGSKGQKVSTRAIERAEPHVVRLRRPLREAEQLLNLIRREAAKACVEYVSIRAAPELALLPELDALRRYAREEQPGPRITVSYRGPSPLVRLPRQGRVLVLGEGPPPPQNELDRLVDEHVPGPILQDRPELSHIPSWPGFEHRLQLVKDQEGTRFELTLFTAIVVSVLLPTSLPLPWGCRDTKDLASGLTSSDSPWTTPPIPLERHGRRDLGFGPRA